MTECDAVTSIRQSLTAEYFAIYDMLCIVQDITEQEGDPTKHLRVIKSMLGTYNQHVQAALKQ